MVGGVYDGTDLANKTFFGFKVDPSTGRATLEIIEDSSVVMLPYDPTVTGYRTYFWTDSTMDFSVTSDGHLQVTVL